MNYGVLPTGFSRKPLAVILAEVEAQLITEFGPEVIQTAQSPLGQLNGLFADLVTELWEIAEDVYQSYDPNQAEGTRLNILGNIRLIKRGSLENDAAFRQAITNQGVARIALADLSRAIQSVSDVRYRQVFVNETTSIDQFGLPPNTVSVAVLGGDNEEIAAVVNRYVTPGISTHGNVEINVVDEGFCRSMFIVRPIEVPVELTIRIRATSDGRGCPAPSTVAIASALLSYLRDPETRPRNGQNITRYTVRSFIESTFPMVEFIELQGMRDGIENPDIGGEIPFEFIEIADVESVQVLAV